MKTIGLRVLLSTSIAVSAAFQLAPPLAAGAASAALPFCAPSIAAGQQHSVAVKSDGTAYGWGDNSNGQVGNNDSPNDTDEPALVTGVGGTGNLSGVVAVAAGGNQALALLTDGTVRAWGRNAEGELGDNNAPNDSDSPVQVVGPGGTGTLGGIVAVAEGRYHSLALKSDGTVWAWGNNSNGQLGDGNGPTDSPTPVQVLGAGGTGVLSGVVAIGAGNYYSMALKSDGTVWTWGQDDNGQLGDGDPQTDSDTPVQVVGPGGVGTLGGVVAIAPNRHQALVLRSDGTVWAWGNNANGELGDNSTTERHTPVQVVGAGGSGFLTDVIAVAMGGHHALAAKSDGSAWGWGRNADYQVGDGTNTERHVPTQVVGAGGTGTLAGVESVTAGDHHSLALRTDGTIWGWGRDNSGEVGNNTSGPDVQTPSKVSQETGLTSVAGSCLLVGAVSPATAACSGGSTVVLAGSGFLGATQVRFGDTAAQSFTVDSDTHVTAVTPAGTAGKVNVTVTTPRGTSAATVLDEFTCTEPPALPAAGAAPSEPRVPLLPALVAMLLLAAGLAAWQLRRRGAEPRGVTARR
ncbi:MAG: hypothetical protein QOE92_233 [Chloroflexota bacterium]|nr:hypothetical protein [Chloroflexota bacterium]